MKTNPVSIFHGMFNPVKFCSIIITLFSLTFAGDAANISTIIKKIDSRFSGIASTKKIGTMSIDSMNTFFETVIEKIPSIETLMRINSSGKVINEISETSRDFKMRNVSDQKWFVHVKKTLTPYYGTNRDTSGAIVFFWAWPITSGDSVFNGAISAKIKPDGILKMATVRDSSRIALLFNDLLIFKQNISEMKNSQNDTISLSSGSVLIIQTPAIELVSADTVTKDSALSQGITSDSNDTMKNAGNETAANVTQPSKPASPVVYKSDYLEQVPRKKHAPLAAIILILLSLLFLSAALYIFLRGRNRHSQSSATLPDITPEELASTKIDIEKLVEEETLAIVDPNSHSEISDHEEITVPESIIDDTENSPDEASQNSVSVDDDTRSHPPQIFSSLQHTPGLSLVSDKSGQELIETTAYEIPPELKIRNSVYKEVHNEVMQWVIAESSRLENRIEELEHRLSIIEKLNTPEIKQIKKDIQDISRDIDVFKSNNTK